MPKNGRNFTCNLARNFAPTYSGKAITQSKIPNSTDIEIIDAELASHDAAGRDEENTSGIKTI